jgi:hypothetical protein
MTDYYSPVSADEVTDEILTMVTETVDGWYQDGRIDWQDVWDRVDGSTLDDGRTVDFGDSLDSPAIRKIKKHVRDHRHD